MAIYMNKIYRKKSRTGFAIFENMIDIVQDEIPVDVIEIDSQLLEL